MSNFPSNLREGSNNILIISISCEMAYLLHRVHFTTQYERCLISFMLKHACSLYNVGYNKNP